MLYLQLQSRFVECCCHRLSRRAAEELEDLLRKTCIRSVSQGTKQGPWLQFLRLLLKCGIENMAVCVAAASGENIRRFVTILAGLAATASPPN